MLSLREVGLKHAYFDEKILDFSNVAVGLMIRAIGHNLKVLYVDTTGKSIKLKLFFQNLGLYEKNLEFIDISRINLNEFSVNDSFDLVIFDNVSFNKITLDNIFNFNKNKSLNMEVVFVFSSLENFEILKNNFDLVSVYEHKNIIRNSKQLNMSNITGNGKGKSTYLFGYIIRELINKKDVNLIYFDKGGDFYGEKFFFNSLKEKLYNNKQIGKFDFFVTGLVRFDGINFRFKNLDGDKNEAERGLLILTNLAKKENLILMCDELNTTIDTYLLSFEDIVNSFKLTKNKVVISGRSNNKKLVDLAMEVVEVIDFKHYLKTGFKVRKGIDY